MVGHGGESDEPILQSSDVCVDVPQCAYVSLTNKRTRMVHIIPGKMKLHVDVN